LGGLVDLHLLFGQDEVFAFGTVPGVLLAKNLRLFEEFETVLYGGSGLFFALFLLTVVAISLDIIEFFIDFFIIFPPVKFDLNLFGLIFEDVIESLLISVLEGTSLTAFNKAELAFTESGGWNGEESEGLFFFRDVDDLLFVVLNWVKLLVVGVEAMMDFLECGGARQIVQSVRRNVFSVGFIAVG
jgi:hypothetical protein